jgi:hypothetical protein
MHVKFDEIARKLPAVETVESYFKGFVEAMEDMNVVLDRGVPAPRPEVLAKGRFIVLMNSALSRTDPNAASRARREH